jgi:hypothetical protein
LGTGARARRDVVVHPHPLPVDGLTTGDRPVARVVQLIPQPADLAPGDAGRAVVGRTAGRARVRGGPRTDHTTHRPATFARTTPCPEYPTPYNTLRCSPITPMRTTRGTV